MRAALLALAFCTAAALPAAAQTAGATVQVRTRADAVGDVYRYRSETTFEQKDDHGGQSQRNTLAFDLEVLGAETDGLRLRYTLREGRLHDSGGASMSAAIDAAVGGSLDFRIGRGGAVVAVETWPAYKTRLLARVDAALPANDPIRALVHERMESAPLDAAREMVLGDVVIMSAMEMIGPLPVGHTELNDPDAIKASLDVKVAKPGCRVALERRTIREVPRSVRATVTKAELAIADGRVLTLEERRATRAAGGSQEETIVITRLDPPAC